MPTPRATQARDELGLKARLHGTPPDDVGLDAGSSLREGTGLWGCDELGLKARLHGTPPDDVGLDAGSSLREGTGLWGWLWGPWRFSPAPRGYVHFNFKKDIRIQPGTLNTERIGVAPLMARQVPVAVGSLQRRPSTP